MGHKYWIASKLVHKSNVKRCICTPPVASWTFPGSSKKGISGILLVNMFAKKTNINRGGASQNLIVGRSKYPWLIPPLSKDGPIAGQQECGECPPSRLLPFVPKKACVGCGSREWRTPAFLPLIERISLTLMQTWSSRRSSRAKQPQAGLANLNQHYQLSCSTNVR